MTLKSEHLSRRRLLGGGSVAMAGVASLLAVGCGGNDDDDAGETPASASGSTVAGGTQPAPATNAPRKGGILRTNQTGDIVLNTGFPFLGQPATRLLPWLLTESLIRYRTDVNTPELVLADRFEYNADRTKLVVSIKQGAEFHNGAPVTPEDVFFGVDFLLDPVKFGVTVSGAPNVQAKAIVAKTKLDSRTMEFTFDRPRYDMTGFFLNLAVTHAASFPKLLTGEDVQGTGPYAFKEWKPGVSYSFVRNDKWHLTSKEGGPYLDGVEVRALADESAAAIAFEAGELDIAFRLPGSEAKRFRDKVKAAPRIGGLFLGLIVKNPALADARVRRAIFHAIDTGRIAKELGEDFYPATSQIWPAYSPAFDPALEKSNYDLARAKSLLAEAGFTQSKPFDLEFTARSTLNAQVVKDNLNAVGVQVNLVPKDSNEIVNRIRQRQIPDMFMAGTNFSDPVPASALAGNNNTTVQNSSYQENPELGQILQALGTLDPASAAAKEQYKRFNTLWMEDPWIIPLEPSGALDALGPKVRGLDGYFISPLQAPNFGAIWLAS